MDYIERLRDNFDEMVVYKDLKKTNFFSALSLTKTTLHALSRNSFRERTIGTPLKIVLSSRVRK